MYSVLVGFFYFTLFFLSIYFTASLARGLLVKLLPRVYSLNKVLSTNLDFYIVHLDNHCMKMLFYIYSIFTQVRIYVSTKRVYLLVCCVCKLQYIKVYVHVIYQIPPKQLHTLFKLRYEKFVWHYNVSILFRKRFYLSAGWLSCLL